MAEREKWVKSEMKASENYMGIKETNSLLIALGFTVWANQLVGKQDYPW